MNEKVIIDVDTGIDDALAIILAVKTFEKNILGITTCGGNVGIDLVTENTVKILALLKTKIKIYQGSNKTLTDRDFINATDYHGTDGLCNLRLKEKIECKQSLSACDFITKQARSYPELTIISLAPPTNIAKAILKNPNLFKKCNIVMMGGALDVPGNQTKWAEFNFGQDPESVDVVLGNVKNTKIVTLDTTNKCLITKEANDQLTIRSETGKFLKKSITNWYNFFGIPKSRSFELYDPLAISCILNDFVKFENINIEIVKSGQKRGMTRRSNKYPIDISVDVKANDFIEYFIKTINQG